MPNSCDAYNPLESGMAWVCAENKGCYTGQEIIARQVTYDKVTRTLVGLQSDGPLNPGAAVQVDGRSVGSVTSAVYSPQRDAYVGLAILKRPHNSAGWKSSWMGGLHGSPDCLWSNSQPLWTRLMRWLKQKTGRQTRCRVEAGG